MESNFNTPQRQSPIGVLVMFGNTLQAGNAQPIMYGYYITDSANYANRHDSIRTPNEFYGYMRVPSNKKLECNILIFDDSTRLDLLTINTLKLSKYKDDFSNAVTLPAQFYFPPLVVKSYNSTNDNAYFVYKTYINTGLWNTGDTIYMRYYAKDQNHSFATETPKNSTEWYWKTRFSFIIN